MCSDERNSSGIGAGVIMDNLFANQLQLEEDIAVPLHPASKNGQLKRRFSRTSVSILMENEMTTQPPPTPLTPTRAPAPLPLQSQPQPQSQRIKASDRRSRCFQRAFSCDVNGSASNVRAEKPSRTCRSQELEMTYVEGQDKSQAGGMEPDSGNLTKGAGIVCSDEDLRLILTEVAQSRRLSADAKREKMKSNRSLSLDSSFFKLHMKRLQADSPSWLSRILNQKETTKSIEANGFVSTESSSIPQTSNTSTSSNSSDDQMRNKRSTNPRKPEATPETIVEDAQSLSEGDDILSSRRESNVSCGSDDERSLLLNTTNVNMNNNNNNVNFEVNMLNYQQTTETQNPTSGVEFGTTASKVVWTEGSVVDAEVLGSAIEIYLTSVNTSKKPSTSTSTTSDSCKCGRPDTNTGDNGQSSGIATLKGLFVK